MRTAIIGAICVVVITGAAICADTTFTESQIGLALDYAKSGMTKEAKDFLIPLLHDSRELNLDSKVRYCLGAICLFLESDEECANYHWEQILRNEPNGPEADAVRGIQRNREFLASQTLSGYLQDWSFSDDLKTARCFWSYKMPDYKTNPKDLRDEHLAMDYYDMLLAKYPDPLKHAQLLFDKFLILAGFNNEDYGYLAWGTRRDPEYYWEQCEAISDSLKMIPEAKQFYVHSQFLLGVMGSGTKFLSSAIKLNGESAKYFENVMTATEGQNTNVFRIFAAVWLKKFRKEE